MAVQRLDTFMFANPVQTSYFLEKHKMCFAGIHQLFPACVGFKPQRTTSASLILKSTVCTFKFAKFVFSCIMLLPQVYHQVVTK